MAFGHIRRTQTHGTQKCEQGSGQPGIKDERLERMCEEGGREENREAEDKGAGLKSPKDEGL